MEVRSRLATILILLTWATASSACDDNDVSVYNIKLQFLQEDSDVFGFDTSGFKWTNIFGQSHNISYALYIDGEEIGPLVKSFIQSGNVEGLLEASEEEPKVYDQFTAVVGDNTEPMVLVSGGHHLVSFISPMASSPHWFVGVDSLPLCVNSFWIDQVTLKLEPMQLVAAGEYSSRDPEIVKRVSSNGTKDSIYHKTKHASHIAKVEFTKIKEYSTLEVNSLARKELITELKSNKEELPRQKSYYNDTDSNESTLHSAKAHLETLKALEEDPVGTPKPELAEKNVEVVTRAPVHKRHLENEAMKLKNMDEVMLAVANGNKLGLGKHLPRHFRSRLHHAINRHSDCQVSDWSEWSPCTEPCGSGHTVRMRTMTQQREGEGRGCPHLIESKTCGHPCGGDDDYEMGKQMGS